MKKILFIIILALSSVILQAQTFKPIFVIPDKATTFGRTIPAGSLIFESDSLKIYKLTAKYISTKTMSDVFSDGNFSILKADESDPIALPKIILLSNRITNDSTDLQNKYGYLSTRIGNDSTNLVTEISNRQTADSNLSDRISSDSTNLVTNYIPLSQKGSSLGVAPLDGSGKLSESYLPSSVLGSVSLQGNWDASTNTPTLASGVGNRGDYYLVSVDGATEIDGISEWKAGDWIVFGDSSWGRINNDNKVNSVNGFTNLISLYLQLSGDLLNIVGDATTINLASSTSVSANNAFRTTPSSVITAGTNIDWTGNILNVTGVLTSESDPIYSAWDKSSGISITESQISDFGSYEPSFAKNTAFNKNFGTIVGTVAQGNDSRILNGQTAYGWGNWSTGVNKTFVDALGINATQLNSQNASYYLSRTNHTGTQTASTISDFDTEVSNNTDVAANTAFRTTPSSIITAGTNIDWTGNILNITGVLTSNPTLNEVLTAGNTSTLGITLGDNSEITKSTDGTIFRISSTQQDAYHSTSIPFGALEFYSADESGSGAGVRGAIRVFPSSTTGTGGIMKLSSDGDVSGLEIDNNQDVSIPNGNLTIDNGVFYIKTDDQTGAWSVTDDGSENLQIRANSGVEGGFIFQQYDAGYQDIYKIDANGDNIWKGSGNFGGCLYVNTTGVSLAELFSSSTTDEIYIGKSKTNDETLVLGYNQITNEGYLQIYGDSKGDAILIKNGGDVDFGNNITAPTIKLTSGANSGYVLTSDASGNASWSSPATSLSYQGTWDASTNTPTLSDATGTNGYVYVVSVTGTRDLGSGLNTWNAGNFAIHNGSIWEEVGSDANVSSVFGRTGAVVAATNDYTWAQIDKTTSSIADITSRSHNSLTDIGTNTHAQIDAHIALDATTSVKGHASFGASDFDVTSGAVSIDYTNGQAASTSTKGFLTSTDWNTFNNKVGTEVDPVYIADTLNIAFLDTKNTFTQDQTASAWITTSGTSSQFVKGDGSLDGSTYLTGNETITLSGDATGNGTTAITVAVVDDSHNHIISNVDGLQTALDGKEPTLTKGDLTESTSNILTITGGTNAVLGSGSSIEVQQAGAAQSGYLTSTDWNTFNNKTDNTGTVTSVGLTTGTTGTDVNVSGSPIISSGTITLNIPDAGLSERGLITTGTQTIAGAKTFSSDVTIPSDAYSASGWNGVQEAAPKDAIRDKLESLAIFDWTDQISITSAINTSSPGGGVALTHNVNITTPSVSEGSYYLPTWAKGTRIVIMNHSGSDARININSETYVGYNYMVKPGNLSVTSIQLDMGDCVTLIAIEFGSTRRWWLMNEGL